MSSQDKTGPQDGSDDAATGDHAPDTATELSETGDAAAESPRNDVEFAETGEDDGIEDADVVDDVVAASDDEPGDTLDAHPHDTGDSPYGPDDGEAVADADDTAELPDFGDAPDDADDADGSGTDTTSVDPVNLSGAAAATAALAGTAAAASFGTTGTAAGPAPAATPAPDAGAKAAPQKSGGGFVPALLGGVIAAGIGFGTAVYLGGALTGGDDTIERALSAQDDKLTALDARLAALADAGPDDQIAALGDRLAGQLGDVAARIDTLAGTVDTVQGGVASLEDRLDELGTGLSDVTERLGAVERRPLTESSEAAQAAFTAYEDDLADLRAALEQQTAINADLTAQLEERTAAAQAEIDAAAARAAELQAQAEEQARVAAAQAEEQARIATEQADARAAIAALREALASLDSSLEKGAPFADALDVLRNKGAVPQALTDAAASGVASLADLRAAFPDLARDALDASIRETVADDMTGRIYAFALSQTGLRSLEPREGDDPDAVLSRAEAALRDGDLATTLTELEQLPPAGQDVLSDWMARAEQRRDVTEAATTLADTLLAN